MNRGNIEIPGERLAEFCRRWKVAELSLFGSALRGDFGPKSDVDLLVEFAPGASWSLFEWMDMIEELKAILGREVDLVSKQGLRNPYRRRAILGSREVLYAA
jgi:predicted nucleotidyltransferase